MNTETQMQTALAALRDSTEVQQLLEQLQEAQAASERDGSWDTKTGRKTEQAWGHLRMALEAAGSN